MARIVGFYKSARTMARREGELTLLPSHSPPCYGTLHQSSPGKSLWASQREPRRLKGIMSNDYEEKAERLKREIQALEGKLRTEKAQADEEKFKTQELLTLQSQAFALREEAGRSYMGAWHMLAMLFFGWCYYIGHPYGYWIGFLPAMGCLHLRWSGGKKPEEEWLLPFPVLDALNGFRMTGGLLLFGIVIWILGQIGDALKTAMT